MNITNICTFLRKHGLTKTEGVFVAEHNVHGIKDACYIVSITGGDAVAHKVAALVITNTGQPLSMLDCIKDILYLTPLGYEHMQLMPLYATEITTMVQNDTLQDYIKYVNDLFEELNVKGLTNE